jgi:hypothetical protein
MWLRNVAKNFLASLYLPIFLMEQLSSLWTYFRETLHRKLLLKSFGNIQFWIKANKNIWHLARSPKEILGFSR